MGMAEEVYDMFAFGIIATAVGVNGVGFYFIGDIWHAVQYNTEGKILIGALWLAFNVVMFLWFRHHRAIKAEENKK